MSIETSEKIFKIQDDLSSQKNITLHIFQELSKLREQILFMKGKTIKDKPNLPTSDSKFNLLYILNKLKSSNQQILKIKDKLIKHNFQQQIQQISIQNPSHFINQSSLIVPQTLKKVLFKNTSATQIQTTQSIMPQHDLLNLTQIGKHKNLQSARSITKQYSYTSNILFLADQYKISKDLLQMKNVISKLKTNKNYQRKYCKTVLNQQKIQTQTKFQQYTHT